MTISAKVIAASAHNGYKIATLELVYPRFIHSEFMTHRMFSRNASSSRAIPFKAMVQQIIDDVAMPVEWGKEQKGMQARETIDPDRVYGAEGVWRSASLAAVQFATMLSEDYRVHKQVANRILEPFLHIRVVCTATEWDNFFRLRLHPDAQPEIRVLAERMKEALDSAEYKDCVYGEWHLPYVGEELELMDTWDKVLISAARCARVSYRRSDGAMSDYKSDIALATRLMLDKHLSPFEHMARPAEVRGGRAANFVGWESYRYALLDN